MTVTEGVLTVTGGVLTVPTGVVTGTEEVVTVTVGAVAVTDAWLVVSDGAVVDTDTGPPDPDPLPPPDPDPDPLPPPEEEPPPPEPVEPPPPGEAPAPGLDDCGEGDAVVPGVVGLGAVPPAPVPRVGEVVVPRRGVVGRTGAKRFLAGVRGPADAAFDRACAPREEVGWGAEAAPDPSAFPSGRSAIRDPE